MKWYDFLVIGGGISGLTFALRCADHGDVAVLFKKKTHDSSTSWAQGGIAAVAEEDDTPELHIKDTIISGANLCDENIVSIVVNEGPERVAELIERGVEFDKEDDDDSSYHLHKEGGHSRRRIFHATDATGYEIQDKLLKKARSHPRITFYDHSNAIDLITTRKIYKNNNIPNRVLGAYVLQQDDNKVETFLAKKTVMSTGGSGKVYLYTSNPDVASGDGIAMCFRAGVPVANMEFFQFHPTCLYNPKAKSFLITEAMRGEGALLRRKDGTRFMPEYDSRAELASRDIVARAIDSELKKTGDDHVYLDITHKSPEFIVKHFPNITSNCLKFGIDITKEQIPVVPAAHFCCGGVIADEKGRTSVVNLYAIGECSYSGLHGANRLASNSLLEGIVFGERSARDAITNLPKDFDSTYNDVPVWSAVGVSDSHEQVVISQNWSEIRHFMWNYVGIVRSDKRLERALRRSTMIEKEINEYYWNFHVTSDLIELRNLSLVANLVIRSAINRKESRGLHYNVDYPKPDEKWRRPTVLDPTQLA